MATASPNTTVTATNFAGAQVLFDATRNGSDPVPVSVYTIHNRDSTNSVRVVVTPLHNSADGGAVVPPGGTVPFTAAHQITKVVVWAESGTPAIDGFIEAL